MSIRSEKLLIATVMVLLVSSIALAHSDGIYNPTANSVGSFEGIDSNGSVAQPTGKLLMVDAVSHVLQVDAVSKVCLAGGC